MSKRLAAAFFAFAVSLFSAAACLAGPNEDFREGMAAAQSGDMDKAMAAFSRIIDAAASGVAIEAQNLASAYNLRGMCHEVKNEADKALADYTKAIETDVKMAEAYGNRAMLYMKLGEVDKAKADATAAKRIDRKVKVPNFQ
ncbi:MAG: tetratricopeptide repeat protein [Solidesulfovibrio sp. DCME]|uniref:tetratricopeptide repeat protein n=1 Tax=Solidesulfovibrio sp. DCME TaxID=3447380 RepID=UPI003D0D3A0F